MIDTKILPSLYSSDVGQWPSTFQTLQRNNTEQLHLDVMDGHFVPDMAFGPSLVENLRADTDFYLDVHLMTDQPECLVERFLKAGADGITFHIESTSQALDIIKKIRSYGKDAGVALTPATSVANLEPVLNIVDSVLVMTNNPGTSDQNFWAPALDKIQDLAHRRQANNYKYRIEVDGNITADNIIDCYDAGADWFVSGDYIFAESQGQDDRLQELSELVGSNE
ncbi:ribulose-phosphate 3-epimerase [Xylocopilactobacillus apis]|uniref:Ribulose-phosphate 3-epimerase n=1 Tax=Xylocopilactobacillus apis TaxID=2932183 RepID=A0AAU9D752_9LACO|nr:ribulose-phosphate 3-epimerase [Xylocopilactobacillus apis]BDR55485.1 ribulose-phosphate 3-epimerase [Xylocopilactobacillus apis]